MTMNLKVALAWVVAWLAICGAGQSALAKPDDTKPDVPDAESVDSPAQEESSDLANPYEVISERNVFRLQTPPPPTNDIPPPEPPPTVKLTGFIKLEGQPIRALFVSIPKDPKKDDIAYYNLREGEQMDKLELVKIMEAEEAAEIVNAGVKSTVKLKDEKDKDGKDRKKSGSQGGPADQGRQGSPGGRPSGPGGGFPGSQSMGGNGSPDGDGQGGVQVGGASAPPTPPSGGQDNAGSPPSTDNNAGTRKIPTRSLRSIPPPVMPGQDSDNGQ